MRSHVSLSRAVPVHAARARTYVTRAYAHVLERDRRRDGYVLSSAIV